MTTTIAFPAASVSGAFDHVTLVVFWATTAVGVLAPRTLFNLLARARRRPRRSVLIVGSGPRALEMERRLLGDPDVAFHVVGFVDSPSAPVAEELHGRILADLGKVEELLMRQAIDEVDGIAPHAVHVEGLGT